MRQLYLAMWGFAMGAIVIYLWFTTIGSISPREIGGVTLVIACIAVLWFVRAARIEFEVKSRGGDPQLREAHNRARERRGF